MKLLLGRAAIPLVLLLAMLSLHESGASTPPTAEVKALREAFVNSQEKTGLVHDKALRQVTEYFSHFKRQLDGQLYEEDLDVVLMFLRLENKDHWFRQLMVEENLRLFQDNQVGLSKKLIGLPREEVASIKKDMGAVFREVDKGN